MRGLRAGPSLFAGRRHRSHFSARAVTDMTTLMDQYPQFLGIGLDESTALVVQGRQRGNHRDGESLLLRPPPGEPGPSAPTTPPPPPEISPIYTTATYSGREEARGEVGVPMNRGRVITQLALLGIVVAVFFVARRWLLNRYSGTTDSHRRRSSGGNIRERVSRSHDRAPDLLDFPPDGTNRIAVICNSAVC